MLSLERNTKVKTDAFSLFCRVKFIVHSITVLDPFEYLQIHRPQSLVLVSRLKMSALYTLFRSMIQNGAN